MQHSAFAYLDHVSRRYLNDPTPNISSYHTYISSVAIHIVANSKLMGYTCLGLPNAFVFILDNYLPTYICRWEYVTI